MPRTLITAAIDHELAAWAQGYRHILGIDEAGRGAWAGPVYAAAVCLPVNDPKLTEKLAGVRDSKKLSERRRMKLIETIKSVATAWGVGWADENEIAKENILRASCFAMVRAYEDAMKRFPGFKPGFMLIDSIKCPELVAKETPYNPIVRGDQLCMSIAAASILAKETRDQYMRELDHKHPEYEFSSHKGYGTKKHQAALKAFGASPHHRMTFSPLRRLSENRNV
jgi:ribonuclease HII